MNKTINFNEYVKSKDVEDNISPLAHKILGVSFYPEICNKEINHYLIWNKR